MEKPLIEATFRMKSEPSLMNSLIAHFASAFFMLSSYSEIPRAKLPLFIEVIESSSRTKMFVMSILTLAIMF